MNDPDKQLFLLRYGRDTTVTYPDFSRPRHRDEFFTWLCRERPEMWLNFRHFAFKVWIKDMDATAEFIPWLFFQSPSRPRDLMAEWLRLDETVERFGTTEVCSEFNRWHNPCPQFCDKCDDGSGKVLAPWAKYAKEGHR